MDDETELEEGEIDESCETESPVKKPETGLKVESNKDVRRTALIILQCLGKQGASTQLDSNDCEVQDADDVHIPSCQNREEMMPSEVFTTPQEVSSIEQKNEHPMKIDLTTDEFTENINNCIVIDLEKNEMKDDNLPVNKAKPAVDRNFIPTGIENIPKERSLHNLKSEFSSEMEIIEMEKGNVSSILDIDKNGCSLEDVKPKLKPIEEHSEKTDKLLDSELEMNVLLTTEGIIQHQLEIKNVLSENSDPIWKRHDADIVNTDRSKEVSLEIANMQHKKLLSDTEDLDILLARHKLIQGELRRKDKSSKYPSEIRTTLDVDRINVGKLLDEGCNEGKMYPAKQDSNTRSNMDDIDVLLCRHDLIRQQLSMVSDEDDIKNQSDVFEKESKKKRRTKKKRKSKVITGNGPSSSKLGCENSSPLGIQSIAHVPEKHNFPDKLDYAIEEELLALRKEAVSHKVFTDDSKFTGAYNKTSKRLKTKQHLSDKILKPLENEHGPNQSKFAGKKFNAEAGSTSKTKSSIYQGKPRSNGNYSNLGCTKASVKHWRNKKGRRQAQIMQNSKLSKSKGYPSYSAQQEREVKILQKQQEEMAFDNYSNIPMEIEDDDDLPEYTDKIIAPLPLIEMPEVRPPLPPSDEFRPVPDPTALCMTQSNVAWMPGFVETLDADVNVLSPKIDVINEASSSKIDEDENKNDTLQSGEGALNEDDADVWALRAQALKSLACKRAVRAKELNKNKKIKPVNENSTITKENTNVENTNVENIPSDVATPVSLPVLKPVAAKKRKALYSKKPPPPPPKHPKVIIQLTNSDFESESDNEESELINDHFNFKIMTKRRKSVPEETLLKDLQGYIMRCRLRMKRNSSSIVKDQLIYKKLQSEISKQKILFEEQKAYVKKLQEELQLATKRKSATLKTHNKLHQKIKNIKDQLKEKIQVRNTTDERILRAKTIVSVNKFRGNVKTNIDSRLKSQILTLIETLRESYQLLLNAETTYITTSDNIIHISSGSNLSEPENGHNSALEKAEIINSQEKLTNNNSVRLDTGKLEINDSSLDSPNQVMNIDNQDVLCKASKGTASSEVISSLSALKKFVISQKQSPETSYITYTLSELLQGLGDADSHQVIQVQSDNNINSMEIEDYFASAEKGYSEYRSPLACFKSYRISPRFSSNSMLSIRSPTFSNEIQPDMTICHYDLHGICNDNNCTRTHLDEKCVISTHALVNDLLSYQMNNMGESEDMNDETKQRHLNLYTNQFIKKYGGMISLDKSTTVLHSHIKEFCLSKKKETINTVMFDKRTWFLQDKYVLNNEVEELQIDHYNSPYDNYVYYLNQKMKNADSMINTLNESQEVRYFSKKYDSIELLKKRLAENPSDIKLWVSLVQHILNSDRIVEKSGKMPSSNACEYALSALSQALEENTCSEELWINYLKLYSRNHTTEELRELCYQAVMYAANYDVWWTCLSLETNFDGKLEICMEMIKFVYDGLEKSDKKSHYLTESVLYAIQLFSSCEKFVTAIDYLEIALGVVEPTENGRNNIGIFDVSKCLNTLDKSLLWLCLISLHTFQNLPKCIFSVAESGSSRLIGKKNFLLDWQNGSWNSSEENIRSLFKHSLAVDDRNLVILNDLMILYENVVAFELSLGNIEFALSTLRGVVTEFPTCVDGWRLLLLLYIQFFPTDDMIRIGEEGIINCESNVRLVYFFCKELLKRNLGKIASENLNKCIQRFFHYEDNQGISVAEMYKRVIRQFAPTSNTSQLQKSNSSEDNVYFCLCYCLLADECLQRSPMMCKINTSEAFEYVIHQYHSPEDMKILWMAYMEYKSNLLSSMDIVSNEEYLSFIDLLFQSLVSVSAIGVIKENSNLFWRDYEFHNKLIDMCMAIIPSHEHSQIYRKLINFMPDNISLAIRISNHEYEKGNFEQAKIICSSLLSKFPSCLPLWSEEIKMELECQNVKEVRWLLKEASKALPFSLQIWKKLINFEALYSTDFRSVKSKFQEIVNQASYYGIDIQKILPALA